MNRGRVVLLGILPVLLSVSPSVWADALPLPSGSEGEVSIVTVPERAEVWIDNNYAGLSPIKRKRLAAGSYTIRLIDPLQQASATEVIVVQGGRHLLVERTLSARFGKLRVDTDPPGASVSIAAELGKTPLVNDYINPGIYKIEIRHPRSGYLPVTEEVTFADGQPIAISRKLEKPPLFTTKRTVQLALGVTAAGGWVWAIAEQSLHSSTKQKAAFLANTDPEASKEMSKTSQNAGTRRTIAIITAGALSAALQVTIFVW